VLQLTSVGVIVKQDVALSLLTKMLQDVIQADEVTCEVYDFVLALLFLLCRLATVTCQLFSVLLDTVLKMLQEYYLGNKGVLSQC